MAYVTFEYYKNVFRCGLAEVVPEDAFAFYEKQAEQQINRATFGRVGQMLDSDIPEVVKDAACKIAELIYRREKAINVAEAAGGSGVLSSYSNDGQSATFAVDNMVTDEKAFQAEINGVIHDYLFNSGLLSCEAEPVAMEVYDGKPPDQS